MFYRFVDWDMLTRFLGNGIGHKDQVHHTVPSGDEDEDEPDAMEDYDNDTDWDPPHNPSTAPLDNGQDDSRGREGRGDEYDEAPSSEDLPDDEDHDSDDIGYEEL